MHQREIIPAQGGGWTEGPRERSCSEESGYRYAHKGNRVRILRNLRLMASVSFWKREVGHWLGEVEEVMGKMVKSYNSCVGTGRGLCWVD